MSTNRIGRRNIWAEIIAITLISGFINLFVSRKTSNLCCTIGEEYVIPKIGVPLH